MKNKTLKLLLVAALFPLMMSAQTTTPVIYKEVYAYNDAPVYYYTTLTEKPTFKGGDLNTSFHKWFWNKRVNKGDLPVGLRITLKFIVDTEGKVQDLTIETPLPKEKQLIEKLLKKVPDWTPGKINGIPVNTYVEYALDYTGY